MTASAFVLAAGFGTRLRPLTEVRPKPLVPICGVPALAYSLALCAQHGLREVIVNAHYLGEQLMAWEGDHEGVHVTISLEQPEILGTGGGLKQVADQLAERFVVLNADVLHDVDLSALLAALPAHGAAMALRPHPDDAERYGVVAADPTGRIVALTSLAEAPSEGEARRDTHFTGIHALHRDTLQHVPDGFACIVRSAYTELGPQRRVGSIRHPGVWLDAGDPAAYLQANLDLLHGRTRLALDPFTRAAVFRRADGSGEGHLPEVALEGPVWVGPGARVAPGAALSSSVVGADSVVPHDASLSDCVVWSGVTVPPGVHEGVVFFADGRRWPEA